MSESRQSVPQQFLLLCLNDETGAFESGFIGYGLAAGAIAELMQAGRIKEEDSALVLVDSKPTGDTLLDLALSRFVVGVDLHSAAHWVRHLFRHTATAIEVTAADLIRRGILEVKEGRYLWIFPHAVYPTADPKPERETRRVLKAAVQSDAQPSFEVAVTLALIEGCNALRNLFSADEVYDYALRLRGIVAENRVASLIHDCVAQAIREDDDAAVAGSMTIT